MRVVILLVVLEVQLSRLGVLSHVQPRELRMRAWFAQPHVAGRDGGCHEPSFGLTCASLLLSATCGYSENSARRYEVWPQHMQYTVGTVLLYADRVVRGTEALPRLIATGSCQPGTKLGHVNGPGAGVLQSPRASFARLAGPTADSCERAWSQQRNTRYMGGRKRRSQLRNNVAYVRLREKELALSTRRRKQRASQVRAAQEAQGGMASSRSRGGSRSALG